MARDYKYRAQDPRESARSRRTGKKAGISPFRFMLITGLIIGCVVFLFVIGTEDDSQKLASNSLAVKEKSAIANTTQANEKIRQKVEKVPEPQGPKFEFYTYLPKNEIVVPDHEITTRTREERVGKAKATRYILQAGSYKEAAQADSLHAKLTAMGIESRIEKARVGNVTWHRVTLGPFTRMDSVSSIRSRLRQNGIDAIVTETGQK